VNFLDSEADGAESDGLVVVEEGAGDEAGVGAVVVGGDVAHAEREDARRSLDRRLRLFDLHPMAWTGRKGLKVGHLVFSDLYLDLNHCEKID
jgi:hypothetical protein